MKETNISWCSIVVNDDSSLTLTVGNKSAGLGHNQHSTMCVTCLTPFGTFLIDIYLSSCTAFSWEESLSSKFCSVSMATVWPGGGGGIGHWQAAIMETVGCKVAKVTKVANDARLPRLSGNKT